MNNTAIILLIIALVAIGAAVWMFIERERTRKLKTKFGPEYDRVLEQERNPRRAEAVLDDRQKRVAKYHIRNLTPAECDRFSAEWRELQQHFVDDPRGAIGQADKLVNEALRLRGYPMSDFEQQASDLSVDHPKVVENYRAAHEIALRESRGHASTEDLRRAMQYYRSLFEDMLNTNLHYEEVRPHA
jgi:hypothetical protein